MEVFEVFFETRGGECCLWCLTNLEIILGSTHDVTPDCSFDILLITNIRYLDNTMQKGKQVM